jgi:aryl-alcohol dehydrogenase
MTELKSSEVPLQVIQATVLRDKGSPLRIESLEIDGLRDDEVLVRIVAAGICRTDIHIIDEWEGTEAPVVLGHEGAGVVLQTGKDVKSVAPGDHVVLSYQSCGQCPQCRRGRPWACRYLYELNFGFKRLDGSNAFQRSGVCGHFFGQSSWATHSLATERDCRKKAVRTMISYSGDAGFSEDSVLFAFRHLIRTCLPRFFGRSCVFSPWFGRLTDCR